MRTYKKHREKGQGNPSAVLILLGYPLDGSLGLRLLSEDLLPLLHLLLKGDAHLAVLLLPRLVPCPAIRAIVGVHR